MRSLKEKVFRTVLIALLSLIACASPKKESPLPIVEEVKLEQAEMAIGRGESFLEPEEEVVKDATVPLEDYEIRDYFIAEPDVLLITVWKEPDLKTQVTVRPDGKISFPLVGDLYVRGLTPEAVKSLITQKLSRYIINPLVYVKIQTIESQKVYVLGAVNSPKVVPLTHKTTLLEALSKVGGIKTGELGEEMGDLKNAYVARKDKILNVDFYRLLREKDTSQNIVLHPHDYIYVPFAVSQGSEAFVLGEVQRPGAKSVKEGVRLVEMIAQAEGFIQGDATPHIVVVRGGLKNPKLIRVDYRQILKGNLHHNILIKNQDLIYVSSTPLTKWARIVGKILPTLEMVLFPGRFRDAYTSGGGLRINTGGGLGNDTASGTNP